VNFARVESRRLHLAGHDVIAVAIGKSAKVVAGSLPD
jgi:hypothetical protein